MANEVNLEILKQTFAEARFPVKTAERQSKGVFLFEYNYPDERAAIALRTAFLRKGAEVTTVYKHLQAGGVAGELLSREHVLIPYASEDDLRKFFNDVIDDYMQMSDERSLTAKPESSYVKETRKRRALYR